MDILLVGLVPLYALPKDDASAQDAVGTPRLHEEQEGYALQRNSRSL
jgi:hypothetical protein